MVRDGIGCWKAVARWLARPGSYKTVGVGSAERPRCVELLRDGGKLESRRVGSRLARVNAERAVGLADSVITREQLG